MPVGGAAQFAFEPAVLRAQGSVATNQPGDHQPQHHVGGHHAKPAEVCGDHAEHDHQQDGAGEQLVERVDTLIEHG